MNNLSLEDDSTRYTLIEVLQRAAQHHIVDVIKMFEPSALSKSILMLRFLYEKCFHRIIKRDLVRDY